MDKEVAVCRAVCNFLSARAGEEIRVSSKPDRTERERKAVDLIVASSTQKWAIEHTRIESYERQLKTEAQFSRYRRALEDELCGELPTPGRFVLHIDDETFSAASIKQIDRAKERLLQWIRTNAPKLELTTRSFLADSKQGGPPELPFQVQMYRVTTTTFKDGTLAVGLTSPEQLENRRIERIRRALEDKCPKLHSVKV